MREPVNGWAAALAALAAAVFCGCASHAPAPAASATPSPGAAPTTTTPEPVHIETNGSGDRYTTIVQREADPHGGGSRIAYRLRADSSVAEVAGTRSVARFVRPHITFYGTGGKPLVADSPQAKVTERDKSVVMSGGVRARAADGSVLTCDTLRYDGRADRIHGQGHVVLRTPGQLTLTGRYLAGDVRLEHVRIAQHPL